MKVFFKKILNNKQVLEIHKEIHSVKEKAKKDWKIMIFLFIFLTLVSIFLAISIFLKINSKDLFLANEVQNRSSFSVDEKKLNEILSKTEEKKTNYNILFKNGHQVPDPSI